MASISQELRIAQGSYNLERMARKNNLLSSGLVAIDPNPVFAQGGTYFSVPYLQSMDNATEMERITGSTTITPQTLDNFEVYAPIIYRGTGLAVANYELNREGLTKELGLHTNQIADFYSQDVQRVLKATLDGAFGSSSEVYSTHVLDYTGTGTGTLQKQAVSKAKLLLGEVGNEFNKLVVHSSVYADIEDDCISVAPETNSGILSGSTTIKTYMGMQVIINDTVCSPTAGVYPCYMAYGSPIYLGYQVNMTMYDKFLPEKAGGTHELYFYARYGVGVSGLSFDRNSTNPTNTTLADSSKYTFPFTSSQQLTMVKVLVNSAYGV